MNLTFQFEDNIVKAVDDSGVGLSLHQAMLREPLHLNIDSNEIPLQEAHNDRRESEGVYARVVDSVGSHNDRQFPSSRIELQHHVGLWLCLHCDLDAFCGQPFLGVPVNGNVVCCISDLSVYSIYGLNDLNVDSFFRPQ